MQHLFEQEVNMHNSSGLYSVEGYRLMGAAFEVHNVLGGGLSEELYQEAFEIELELQSIPARARYELTTSYKGRVLNKRYIPDILVCNEIVVELKSVSALAPEHEAQLLNYMRISQKKVGYLINFGPIGQLEWKRFVID
jgi:GxxExxY protein